MIRAFAYIPLYVGWRLAIQVGAVRALGTTSWIRTRRHSSKKP